MFDLKGKDNSNSGRILVKFKKQNLLFWIFWIRTHTHTFTHKMDQKVHLGHLRCVSTWDFFCYRAQDLFDVNETKFMIKKKTKMMDFGTTRELCLNL